MNHQSFSYKLWDWGETS